MGLKIDFEQFFEEHYTKVYNYVYFRLLNKEQAEDVVSTTFIKAFENIDRFDGTQAKVSTWLFKIAGNAVVDHYRKARRQSTVDIDELELVAAEDTASQAFSNVDKAKLFTCLKKLDDRSRSIIALRYWGGLSYAEIAEITGLTDKNVSVILSRSLKKLKVLFFAE